MTALGDIRQDLIEILSMAFGPQEAARKVKEFEDLVRKRAEEGATKAVKKGIAVSAGVTLGLILLSRALRRN